MCGADQIGSDAVVDDRDARSKRLGKGRGLPVRGRDARVRTWKVQLVVGVFHLQAAAHIEVCAGELGVKTHVGPFSPVEKLAIDADAGCRPDLRQKQALAPGRVGHDHVGREAVLLELAGGAVGRFGPQGLDFEVAHPTVGALPRAALGLVAHQLHAGQGWAGVDVQRHHAVALTRQGGGQVLELAGEVLVDEKDVHGASPGAESSHACAAACQASGRCEAASLRWLLYRFIPF